MLTGEGMQERAAGSNGSSRELRCLACERLTHLGKNEKTERVSMFAAACIQEDA